MAARTSESDTPRSEHEHTEDSPRKRPRVSKESNGTPHISMRRKTACQSCRIRKVKCDASRPVCAICKACGNLCEYTDNPVEKLTLETVNHRLSKRLDKLQQGIDGLTEVAHAARCDQRILAEDCDQHLDGAHHLEQVNLLEHIHETSITEPSRDFLQIPAHKTTADTVLTWEVFGGIYPPNSLISVLFEPGSDDSSDGPTRRGDIFTVPGGFKPPDEERIPLLVDNFLQNVHTKNPILDVESLVKHARRLAGEGLGWDAWSCLVLLACALGSVAKPFDAAATGTVSPADQSEIQIPSAPSPDRVARELQQGESCFVLACRRLGALKHTILGAQCHFYAGVYLMYTLRPLLSSQYFQQSSVLYQLYMKTTYGILGHSSRLPAFPAGNIGAMTHKERRLEASLYWSCFKSESEFRVELPLPQSEIASYQHPLLFPSPPSPAGADPIDSDNLSTTTAPTLTRVNTASSTCTASIDEDLELRQHAKQLCNEEESWYYYLTEIALRRIGNRIINTFFRQQHIAWLNVRPLLGIALEFDTQVSSWSAHLPPAMQHYETTYTIRAPGTLTSLGDGRGNHVSRELSWAIDNRLLEMRSWLYQPFLYYLIHHGATVLGRHHSTHSFSSHTSVPYDPVHHDNNTGRHHAGSLGSNVSVPQYDPRLSVGDSHGHGPMVPILEATSDELLNADDTAILHHMITSGIDCNLKILDVRSLRHRHHGLWYDLRSLMCASLILLAVVKSGNALWIPGGVEVLWGTRSAVHSSDVQGAAIGGKIGHVLAQFEYWAAEAPDLIRHREVLDEVAREVRHLWGRTNIG